MWPLKKKVVEKPIPVKMSLSTHKAYPAILAQPDGSFEVRIHARDGTTLEMLEGKEETRELAIEKAVDWVQSRHANYLKKRG